MEYFLSFGGHDSETSSQYEYSVIVEFILNEANVHIIFFIIYVNKLILCVRFLFNCYCAVLVPAFHMMSLGVTDVSLSDVKYALSKGYVISNGPNVGCWSPSIRETKKTHDSHFVILQH